MQKNKSVEILTERGELASIEWQNRWDKLSGLPPAPVNPLNDCAKMNHPAGGWTCAQGGCTSKGGCGMYALDLNNPAQWQEVDWPLHHPKANHVYLCRCK